MFGTLNNQTESGVLSFLVGFFDFFFPSYDSVFSDIQQMKRRATTNFQYWI